VGEDGKNKYFRVDQETGEYIQVLIGRQREGMVSEEISKSIRQKTYTKNKNKVKDIVNSNAYAWKDKRGKVIRPKFLTLTFKDDMTDIKAANKQFTNFIKRLNRYIIKHIDKDFIGVQYVAVPEIQESRAQKHNVEVWHYHILMFNMPYIEWKDIMDTWGLGGAYIEGFKSKDGEIVNMTYDDKKQCFMANKSEVKNIGAYITKTMNYMEKNMGSDKLKGEKCYFPSGKLLKSVIINCTKETIKETMTLEKSLPRKNVSFMNAYQNEHVGICLYTEYNTKFTGISNIDIQTEQTLKLVEKAMRDGRSRFIKERRAH
ncbi:MAG: rolling circle replication-associated protein, partial [Bacteroidales bacterium]